ncbi:MAG: DEAD/DEAH box helicase [Staphylococcus equorum]|nr:DEAD/DEAH box helicase [Staphylococcus equorum]
MTYGLYDYQQTLVDQSRKSIGNGSKGVLIQAPPGSGKSIIIAEIARLATKMKNHVLFVVHRKELADQIEEDFIKNDADMDYVTIETVIRAYNRKNTLPRPQVIITDETHHSRAKTYQKLYNHFSDAFRLGFTATPWRMSGDGFTDIYDDLIKGPTVECLIKNKRLAPYRYLAEDSIDRKHLKQNSMGDYDNKSIEKEFSESRIYGDIVKHYNQHAKGHKAIVYAPSVSISEQIAEEFQLAGIKAMHVDGKTNKKERETIMSDFRSGEINVIVNVDLISEGFNVPDCSCVILARPTKSLVLYIQQAMRAMRYQPGKEAIILDHVGNVHEFGLPDMDREWTIKPRIKKKKSNTEPSLAKQCPTCASWLAPAMKVCPFCEHDFVAEERELEIVEGELQEIKNKEAFAIKFREEQFKFQCTKKKPRTEKEYYYFARAKEYKESWLKFKVPQYKQLNFPQFYQQIKPLRLQYNRDKEEFLKKIKN